MPLLRLDHVCLRVADLEAASDVFRRLGFTVSPGGRHGGGLTENALVHFEDGSYLELLTFTKPRLASWLVRSGAARALMARTSNHLKYRFLEATRYPEGLFDAALMVDDIFELSHRLTALGVAHAPPRPFRRHTPNAVELRWNMVCPFDSALPFVRDPFVPEARLRDEVTHHPNGATGIAEIHYAVSNPDATQALWNALGDADVRAAPEGANRVTLGSSSLIIHPRESDDAWNGWVSSTRDKPVRVLLWTRHAGRRGPLALPHHWHGALSLV